MMSATTDNSSQLKGLLRYHAELEDEIFAFQRETYPHRDGALVEPRWKWMFLEPARRLGVEPMVWLYRRQGQVVAHQGAIGVEFQLGGRRHKTGWFVETMAHESVRGKAIGPMVIQKALEDLPFNLSLGQTETMRSVQFALGWQEVAPLCTYALPINPHSVLKGKIRNPLARFAAAQMLDGQRRWKRFRYPSASRGVQSRTIGRFDASHDRLWESVSGAFPCAVVRDAAFLNWKFADQPGQDAIMLQIEAQGVPRALVIFIIREPDSDYSYRRAVVLDLIIPPNHPELIAAALDALVKQCCDRKADMIFLDLLQRDLEAEIVKYGFLPREAERVLLLSTQTLAAEEEQQIMNPANWLLTRADSDIDRPW